LKVNLWDTAGEEKFRSMLPMYYKDAKAALVVYDIGSMDTFSGIEYWVDALSDNVKKDGTVLFLVGNKKDIDLSARRVETAFASKFAADHGMMFTEVSAKTGDGVADLFRDLAEELAKRNKY